MIRSTIVRSAATVIGNVEGANFFVDMYGPSCRTDGMSTVAPTAVDDLLDSRSVDYALAIRGLNVLLRH
ncbi:MAG: hypothetical protein PHV78_01785 [Patescibacteria group bacterium]|nr:hypothetical protein [Patescibacteria group bacterium]MDD5121120.1 hypothetical protein [Patescibacteria group bacterium]MDD5222151.1 hypothetical protein [Patescibacteria group bacterium]MDD5395961.1 hypothetical protein [Patescibacteria group bacterium]